MLKVTCEQNHQQSLLAAQPASTCMCSLMLTTCLGCRCQTSGCSCQCTCLGLVCFTIMSVHMQCIIHGSLTTHVRIQAKEIQLALRSGVRGSVAWSLNALTVLSFDEAPPRLLPQHPGLLEALLEVFSSVTCLTTWLRHMCSAL